MKDKKKLIAIIVASVVVVAGVVVAIVLLTRGNGNSGSGSGDGNNTSNSSNSSSDDAPVAAMPDASSIVGKWKFYDEDLGSMDFIYTFEANGTGQYDLSGSVMPFTYTIDGNKISIVYETGPFETEFEIKGDTLNIKDSAGEDTLYKKVN